MLILALDASTSTVAVALARERGDAREVLIEVSVTARGASEALLPAAHQALVLAGEDLNSVERVLVGGGPGTFTGIRIAASTARSLSLATSAALSKNSTLAALAAPALLGFVGEDPDVLAIIDARRGQVFAQRFSKTGAVGEISCAAPLELPAGPGEPLLVGEGAVRYREELSGLGRIPPDASPLHRVTGAGHALSADLAPVPAAEVVPLYVREPDAEVRRDLNPWIRP